MSTGSNEALESRSRLIFWIGIGLFVIAGIAVAGRWWLLFQNPKVAYLAENEAAPWIRRERPFQLQLTKTMRSVALFRREFHLPRAVDEIRLRVRAFRRFSVWLDQDFEKVPPLYEAPASPQRNWKLADDILLPGRLTAGDHVLHIFVENQGGPAFLALESPELGLKSDTDWQVLRSDNDWDRVVLVTESQALDLEGLFPSVDAAVLRIWPWIASLFGLAFLGSLFSSRLPSRLQLKPSALRYGLFAAWFVLCANNMVALTSNCGFDYLGHLEYIRYVALRMRLPLATDGWQMFQSPLFYMIAAPFYALFSMVANDAQCTKLLRFLPMICGAMQIEICYRSARIVYPDRPDLQSVATLFGGLLPLNLYSAQCISNEPLAGVLTALTLLLCLRLICDPYRTRDVFTYAILGAAWGLAMLAKVSPFVLAPLILLVITAQGWLSRATVTRTAAHVATAFSAAGIVAGWYYVRNLVYLGRPFVGGWALQRGFDWWQDPGFRNWSQFASFGTCLKKPIFSGCWSLADSLYSTIWTDGFLSGMLFTPAMTPWNIPWLVTLAWLGLVPTACLVLGIMLGFCNRAPFTRHSLMFSVAVVGIYLFAIVDMWFQVPFYCAGKMNYMLGGIPCLALLAAAGAGPLLRSVWTRPFVIASLICWGVSSYVTFFCITPYV